MTETTFFALLNSRLREHDRSDVNVSADELLGAGDQEASSHVVRMLDADHHGGTVCLYSTDAVRLALRLAALVACDPLGDSREAIAGLVAEARHGIAKDLRNTLARDATESACAIR